MTLDMKPLKALSYKIRVLDAQILRNKEGWLLQCVSFDSGRYSGGKAKEWCADNRLRFDRMRGDSAGKLLHVEQAPETPECRRLDNEFGPGIHATYYRS